MRSSPRLVLVSFLSLASALAACSSEPPASVDWSKADRARDDEDDEATTDEPALTDEDAAPRPASEGARCGGADRIPCREGLSCRASSTAPDASGTCRRPQGDVGETCGGAEGQDCRADLVCLRTSRGEQAAGTCERDPGEEGDPCGGVERVACRSPLTCARTSKEDDARGTCESKAPSTTFCAQLGRCCGTLVGTVQRLSCGGTVAANNENACRLALTVCLGGGISF